MNDKLHPDIATAKAKLQTAQNEYTETIANIQFGCDHPWVVETPYMKMEFLNDLLPKRMCLVCGYEEAAWHWGPTSYISGVDGCPPTKLRNEFVKAVDRDTFYSLKP